MTAILRRILPFFLAFSTGLAALSAQHFYRLDSVQEYRIYFDQPNWDAILDSLAVLADEPYFVCKRVVINGTPFDSVGVKYKGNSSFRATNRKNPWHIELDHVRGDQNYQGFKDLKLSNVFQDPSFLREALSYALLQPYMHAPQANFARVYVNDALIGLYTNVEAITKTFCRREFQSSGDDNAFFKCNAPNFTGTGNRTPNFSFQTSDSTRYFPAYELKSDFGWKKLVALCDTLANRPQAIEKVLDIDRAIWMMVFNNIFVNLDSYTGGIGHNHYLFEDDNGRFNNIVWDVNQSFASFKNTGATAPANVDTVTAMTLTPFLHETNANKPLLRLILSNPTYRRQYVAHYKTLLEEQFGTGRYKTVGTLLQNTIDRDVQLDANKFYTYDSFRKNFSIAQSGTGTLPSLASFPGIVSMMEGRLNHIRNAVPEMRRTPPSVSNAQNAPALPRLNDSVSITATITGSKTAYVGVRYVNSGIFQKIPMLDNGLNGDGAANDNVFGARVKAQTAAIEYYIYAENDSAGVFLPARAEHEFFKINVQVVSNLNAGDVVINELMADNTKTVQNPKGDFADWAELYNRTNQAISLGGAYLSDDKSFPTKWKFPANVTIAPLGYLVVWLDDDSTNVTDVRPHASFKLSASGESLLLSNAQGVLIDSVTFGKQGRDTSWARFPNATGAFRRLLPTFNGINILTATQDFADARLLSVFPNPTQSALFVESPEIPLSTATLYNGLGQIVGVQNAQNANRLTLNVADLPEGVYFLRVPPFALRKVVIAR